jgi:hypothetical protein
VLRNDPFGGEISHLHVIKPLLPKTHPARMHFLRQIELRPKQILLVHDKMRDRFGRPVASEDFLRYPCRVKSFAAILTPSDAESSNSFGRCARVTLGHWSMGALSEKRFVPDFASLHPATGPGLSGYAASAARLRLFFR